MVPVRSKCRGLEEECPRKALGNLGHFSGTGLGGEHAAKAQKNVRDPGWIGPPKTARTLDETYQFRIQGTRGFGGFDEVETLPSPMVAGRFDSRFDELEIARVDRN